MMNLQIALSQADIQNVTGALHLSKAAVRAAARRAVQKTARSTQTESRRALSAELRLQQKLIRARLRLYRTDDTLTQKVWLGLNAVAAARLGKPRRVAGGTQVGRYFFKDAFPIARYGNGVYRRTGRGRFPLELVKLDIEQTGNAVMNQAAARAEERLMRFLTQELRYELSKINQRGRS